MNRVIKQLMYNLNRNLGPLQIDDGTYIYGKRNLKVYKQCGCYDFRKLKLVGSENEVLHKDRSDFCSKCGYANNWKVKVA